MCDLLVEVCYRKGSLVAILVWTTASHTQPSSYLASLALDKKIDPLMLLTQLFVKFFFEFLQLLCLIVAAGYGFPLTLPLSGADLDEVLDIIVIDVI